MALNLGRVVIGLAGKSAMRYSPSVSFNEMSKLMSKLVTLKQLPSTIRTVSSTSSSSGLAKQ